MEECRTGNDALFCYQPGADSGEIIASILQRVPAAGDRQRVSEAFEPKRISARFQNGDTESRVVYRSRQKDGCLHWLGAVCRAERSRGTDDLFAYLFFRDIDLAQKKEIAAESVIDEETDFVMLVSTITEEAMLLRLKAEYAHLVQKEDGRFAFAECSALSAFQNVMPSDVKSIKDFFKLDVLTERLRKQPVITATYRRFSADGAVRRKKIRAFYMDGVKEDIIIAQRDITDLYKEEQEQKRKLEAASKAKSDFLSRISHDMRTPLNGILGTAYLAMEKDDPAELKKDIETIRISGQLLLNLVNDTLDMNRIESGLLELHPTVCNEKDIFAAIFAAIEPDLKKKNLHLHTNEIGIDWKYMLFDVPRLQQIFVNLFSNAIKFTPEGGDIYWTMECLEEKDDYVLDRFTVRDTGIGMSKEFQQRMFEPFAQENRINTDQTMGSGLGLSIVKSIVGQMGGTITAKSEEGKGTEFCVTLRLPVVSSLPEQPAKADNEPFSLSGCRVLLCEDNHLNAVIAQKLLEKTGCSVETAENGKVGVEKFASSPPAYYSAILMDIRMPVMDGLAATKSLRALDRADAKSVPIIAMSANAYDEDIKASLAAGMNAHLAKPADPQRLYRTLAELIGRQKGQKCI